MTTAPLTLEQTRGGKSELGDYTEFYSHLAMQARRASRVALVACAVALVSIASAILAQLRPPILLRVQDGHVSSLDGSSVQVAETTAQQQPDSAEKLAFVNAFLSRFVNIDPLTVKRDTTLALNQMTYTLRQQVLAQLNQENFVDTVRQNNVTSTLAVKSAELVSGDPYTAVVFGRKRMTTLINGQENEKNLLVKYTIRLRLCHAPRLMGGRVWKSVITRKRFCNHEKCTSMRSILPPGWYWMFCVFRTVRIGCNREATAGGASSQRSRCWRQTPDLPIFDLDGAPFCGLRGVSKSGFHPPNSPGR